MNLRPLLLMLYLVGLSSCQKNAASSTNSVPSSQNQQTQTQQTNDPISGLAWMTVSQLPAEGQKVYRLIGQGGPFRYAKDGSTFGNREKVLPQQQRGYYREYTVKTPSETDRGARRIICGGQPSTSLSDCYYTADHYNTFRRIRP